MQKTLKVRIIAALMLMFLVLSTFGVALGFSHANADEAINVGELNLLSDLGIGGSASGFYLYSESGENDLLYDETWAQRYVQSGETVKINGVHASGANICKATAGNYYLELGTAATGGSTVEVKGAFTLSSGGTTYTFSVNKTYGYTGDCWFDYDNYREDELHLAESAENGIYFTLPENDMPFEAENWAYRPKQYGNSISVNGVNFTRAIIKYRTDSYYLPLIESDNSDNQNVTIETGTELVINGYFGLGSCVIKIKPIKFVYNGTEWVKSERPIFTVSVNGSSVIGDIIEVNVGDKKDGISAVSSLGGNVTIEYAEGCASADGKFLKKADDDFYSDYEVTVSQTSDGVTYYDKKTLRVGYADFAMESGATITESGNGLKFSANISKTLYETLFFDGAQFGMIILPSNYIKDGYELTVENFFGSAPKFSQSAALPSGTERFLHVIPELTVTESGYKIEGSIVDIRDNNLGRNFLGIAYVKLDGAYTFARIPDGARENISCSLYRAAQAAIEQGENADALNSSVIEKFNAVLANNNMDVTVSYTVKHVYSENGYKTVEIESKTGSLNASVTETARSEEFFSVNTETLTKKLAIDGSTQFVFEYEALVASDEIAVWGIPLLDDSNDYDNEYNRQVAQNLVNAGVTLIVNVSYGSSHISTTDNVETLKKIVSFFNTYGIKTAIAERTSGKFTYPQNNGGDLPDLSGVDGFYGILPYDEPPITDNESVFATLGGYADKFKELYAGTDKKFWVNLLPSYAAESSSEYQQYLTDYCDKVLSKLDPDQRILSLDTYPINADYTLGDSFLADLAELKYYSEKYNAMSHVVLQSSAVDTDTKTRMPTAAELRLQAYSALALGIDSISWFTYADYMSGTQNETNTPVGKDNATRDGYTALATVNKEIAAFSKVLNLYTWKGVYALAQGDQEEAISWMKNIDSNFKSQYVLDTIASKSANSLNGFKKAITSTNGSIFNQTKVGLVVGIFQDSNGNYAYLLVNYSQPSNAKTASVTIKTFSSATYTQFGCLSGNVTLSSSGATISLDAGAGVLLVPENYATAVSATGVESIATYDMFYDEKFAAKASSK